VVRFDVANAGRRYRRLVRSTSAIRGRSRDSCIQRCNIRAHHHQYHRAPLTGCATTTGGHRAPNGRRARPTGSRRQGQCGVDVNGGGLLADPPAERPRVLRRARDHQASGSRDHGVVDCGQEAWVLRRRRALTSASASSRSRASERGLVAEVLRTTEVRKHSGRLMASALIAG
jgi:hypothetical protein